jgi:hypothetical protein
VCLVRLWRRSGGDHGLSVGGSNVYSTEANQIIAAFLLQ